MILSLTKFNEKFSGKIYKKEIQIVYEQLYFRNNFIHKLKIPEIKQIKQTNEKYALSDLDKKIIIELRRDVRVNILDIARKTRTTPKTISSRIKKT